MMILISRRTLYICFLFLFAAVHRADAQERLKLSLATGYQSEDFRWSIAGSVQGTDPNILSELKWKNLSGPTAGASAEWNFWKSFSLRSEFSQMFIVSGSVTDADYQGDNRTNRSYYGEFDAKKGSSFSWRTTLEYTFHLDKVKLIPLAGFSMHRQSLYITDQSGTNPNLNSTYATRYLGGVAGLRAEFSLSDHFTIEGGLLCDIVHYRGRANWNLISTFRHPLSFQDDANGYNLEGYLKFCYTLDKWTFFVSGNILHGKTGKGTDMLYLQNGQDVPTQFNEAVRDYIRGGIGARVALF
ncbi:MAG: hypothetical protein J0H74_31600 [Chitinophagaceae bacterium]|nr:hypothetical protein [Chitinophagaceae bacterium]